MTAYLRDHRAPLTEDLPFPLDLTEVWWGTEPILVIAFTPSETREILAALESARKDRYNSASVNFTVTLGHSIYYRTFNNKTYHSHDIDAIAMDIKPYQPYDDAVRETAPNEWVSFERKTYFGSDYKFWKATHKLNALDVILMEMELYGEPGVGHTYGR